MCPINICLRPEHARCLVEHRGVKGISLETLSMASHRSVTRRPSLQPNFSVTIEFRTHQCRNKLRCLSEPVFGELIHRDWKTSDKLERYAVFAEI